MDAFLQKLPSLILAFWSASLNSAKDAGIFITVAVS